MTSKMNIINVQAIFIGLITAVAVYQIVFNRDNKQKTN